MDSFKPRLSKLLEEVMAELYTDVSMYVESDHWTNYRNHLMAGFKGYSTINHKYCFKELRQAIYQNHKEEIIKDLNQDLVEENESLKKLVKWHEENKRGY